MKNKTHNAIKLKRKSLNRLKETRAKLINEKIKILILHDKKEILRKEVITLKKNLT